MRPSEVRIVGYPPLLDTLGNHRLEAAATMLVLAGKRFGDSFSDFMAMAQIQQAWILEVKEHKEPVATMSRNPRWAGDYEGLVKLGFAEWGPPSKVKGKDVPTIRLTQKALDRIEEKWGPIRGVAALHAAMDNKSPLSPEAQAGLKELGDAPTEVSEEEKRKVEQAIREKGAKTSSDFFKQTFSEQDKDAPQQDPTDRGIPMTVEEGEENRILTEARNGEAETD